MSLLLTFIFSFYLFSFFPFSLFIFLFSPVFPSFHAFFRPFFHPILSTFTFSLSFLSFFPFLCLFSYVHLFSPHSMPSFNPSFILSFLLPSLFLPLTFSFLLTTHSSTYSFIYSILRQVALLLHQPQGHPANHRTIYLSSQPIRYEVSRRPANCVPVSQPASQSGAR